MIAAATTTNDKMICFHQAMLPPVCATSPATSGTTWRILVERQSRCSDWNLKACDISAHEAAIRGVFVRVIQKRGVKKPRQTGWRGKVVSRGGCPGHGR
jgi:hypothetical protein